MNVFRRTVRKIADALAAARSLNAPELDLLLIEKFWERVEKVDGCWIWKGAFAASGNPTLQVKLHGKFHMGCRISWQLFNGPLDDSMFVLRNGCDNKECVNPAHLRIGNQNEAYAAARAVMNARRARGEEHSRSKLTWKAVAEIRDKSAKGQGPASLAQEYGVARRTIHDVVNGVSWKENIHA